MLCVVRRHVVVCRWWQMAAAARAAAVSAWRVVHLRFQAALQHTAAVTVAQF
jgi:hypothetical protein